MSNDPLSNKSTTTSSSEVRNDSPLQNKQIGRYLLQDRLGSGGTATVYQAFDQVNGQTVALKVLPSTADANTLERFRREAMTSGGLRHPHIVRTIQVGVASHGGDIAYIAMELIDGESLSQLLTRRGRLHPEESCGLLAPIASALAYAHDEGIVHRDVKPSNILLKPSRAGNPHSIQLDSVDNPIIPMLSDFGIARALDAPELTASGRTVGTPAYMAPEQCRGGYNIDGRADLYALTAVLFRCLVGHQPFLGNTPQILHAHVYEPLKIEDDVFRRLSPLVVEILKNGMAKKPEDRYRNAQELASALASAAGITLTDEQPALSQEPMATVTMPSIETVDEPATVSETIIIPVAGTVGSIATNMVDLSTTESQLQRVNKSTDDMPAVVDSLTRSKSAKTNLIVPKTRPSISPPNQTTETMPSVHIMKQHAAVERMTWAQRIERIRWAWVAFISVGLLLMAVISALFIGGYLGEGRLSRGGTPTVVPAVDTLPNDNNPDDSNLDDNNLISLTLTAESTLDPIVAPNQTQRAQFFEGTAIALTMIAITATVSAENAAAATERAIILLTQEATSGPRFLPAPTALPTATNTPQSLPTPIPPSLVSTPTTSQVPTQTPTATYTVAPPTPTWTVSAENVTATETPTPTDTPKSEIPVIAPTPTWTTEPIFAEDSVPIDANVNSR